MGVSSSRVGRGGAASSGTTPQGCRNRQTGRNLLQRRARMRLEGKVIVVTGGSQGIGEALARRYAREGAGVAILNRDRPAGEAVASSIRDDGGTAVAIECDVSVVPALGAAVAAVHDALGPIDVLVNNAG